MFRIANPANKTQQAVYKAIEAAQESSFRKHLGASVIGRPCQRQLFFIFRWAKEVRHKATLLNLFKRGQNEEAVIVAMLRLAGIQVWDTNPDDIDPETGKERQWRVSDHWGHFGGSLDGVALGVPDCPDAPTLLEFKTHSDNSFAKVRDKGLISSKFEHYIQTQIYMYYKELGQALYWPVNKNDDNTNPLLIKANSRDAETYIEKARVIIIAEEPPAPISTTPAHSACKYCDFASVCFGKEAPARNCRTCIYSYPAQEEGGVWRCRHEHHRDPRAEHDPELTEAEQRAGCEKYEALKLSQ
jgi:hypothetical protein